MTSVIVNARCARVSGRLAGPLFAARVGRRVFETNAAAASPTPKIRYSQRPEESDLFLYTLPPPRQDGKVTNLEPNEVPVFLNDLRNSNDVTLHRNGFELVKFPSGQEIDWEDEDQVKEEYYPEVDALIKRLTGASRTHIMQHGLRRGKVEKRQMKSYPLPGKEDPAFFAHVDFTDKSAPKVLKQHLGPEAAELSQKPWAIIQVWRPLTGPVQDSPLGMMDAATLSVDDILAVKVHVEGGHVHEVNFVAHNPDHKWFWTSQMQADEAYVFVNYESRDDGRARFTPHGAIADPSIPDDAPRRESIETRALVFWDN
ncbi:TPA: hypothetical protein ACH3X3_009633 [Trebouxia sp. C0006]